MKDDASPGLPWMVVATTNGELKELLGKDYICSLVEERVDALTEEVDLRDGPYEFSAESLVDMNLCDPIRLFVKNELHTQEKIDQRRMRLIMSVSVIDQMVERVLCNRQNEAEIEAWATCPSKPGMGLDDKGLQALINNVRAFKRPVQTDVSGFDWAVKEWMLNLDCEARIRLADGGPQYRRLIKNRYWCLSNAVFVLSDGRVFQQIKPGVQKSGSYNTSSTNSRMRWFLSRLAGADGAMAMGDDCVEEFSEHAEERYKELGIPLKEYLETNLVAGVGFCGQVLREEVGRCEPERWLKLVANLLNTKPRDELHRRELISALHFELRHSSKLPIALDIIVCSGWGSTQSK